MAEIVVIDAKRALALCNDATEAIDRANQANQAKQACERIMAKLTIKNLHARSPRLSRLLLASRCVWIPSRERPTSPGPDFGTRSGCHDFVRGSHLLAQNTLSQSRVVVASMFGVTTAEAHLRRPLIIRLLSSSSSYRLGASLPVALCANLSHLEE